jgi:hypothetical protein
MNDGDNCTRVLNDQQVGSSERTFWSREKFELVLSHHIRQIRSLFLKRQSNKLRCWCIWLGCRCWTIKKNLPRILTTTCQWALSTRYHLDNTTWCSILRCILVSKGFCPACQYTIVWCLSLSDGYSWRCNTSFDTFRFVINTLGCDLTYANHCNMFELPNSVWFFSKWKNKTALSENLTKQNFSPMSTFKETFWTCLDIICVARKQLLGCLQWISFWMIGKSECHRAQYQWYIGAALILKGVSPCDRHGYNVHS